VTLSACTLKERNARQQSELAFSVPYSSRLRIWRIHIIVQGREEPYHGDKRGERKSDCTRGEGKNGGRETKTNPKKAEP